MKLKVTLSTVFVLTFLFLLGSVLTDYLQEPSDNIVDDSFNIGFLIYNNAKIAAMPVMGIVGIVIVYRYFRRIRYNR